MNSRLQTLQTAVLAFLLCGVWGRGASPPSVAHFFDEEDMRYLTLRNTSDTGVEVSVRWATDPGSTATWTGQGIRK